MLSSEPCLKLQLRSRVSDADMKARLPAHCEAAEFDVVARGNCVVYRPDGEPLFVLIKQAFTPEEADAAWPALSGLRSMTTNNRATYSAEITSKQGGGGNSNRAMNKDGKVVTVRSVIVGYFDRQGGRHPFCRATAFTANDPIAWDSIVPLARRTAGMLESRLPKHAARQREAIQKVNPAYVIAGTPFTTMTVNNNTRAGIHKDKGDFKDGFGCMAVFRQGEFEGCWLGFPQYRIAADIQHRDLILFNPHEYHANTPYIGEEGKYERISVVFYMREKMQACLSPELEVANARKVRGAIT